MFESAGLGRYIHAEFDGALHFAFDPSSGGIVGDLDVICSQMGMSVYPTCAVYVFSVGGTKR